MADLPNKVSRGSQFEYPADFFNFQIDMAKAYQRDQLGASNNAAPRDRFVDGVFIRGIPGQDVEPGYIQNIAYQNLLLPSDNEMEARANPCFELWDPSGGDGEYTSEHYLSWGVVATAAKATKICRLQIEGAAFVKVDIVDANHRFANPIHADRTKLRSGWVGSSKIVWRESGLGVKWAYVKLGEQIVSPVVVVSMQQTGGASGSATTRCSWTYTVRMDTLLSAIVLASNFDPSPTYTAGQPGPVYRRHALGKMDAATWGFVRLRENSFELLHCNETLVTESCF